MKRLLMVVAMAVLGLAGVRLAAQNPPPKPQQHVITDQDLQDRYHNDNSNTTTDTTTTDQTTQTTTTDQTQTTGTNDVDDLKTQLEKKQKELQRLKLAHNDIGVFITSTQKELAASNDDEDKANLQKRLDENMQDQQKNEADQKRVEKEISDLQDQIKDAENSGTTTTTPTTNNTSSTENSNQTENNSSNQTSNQTDNSNQTQSSNTTTDSSNPPQL